MNDLIQFYTANLTLFYVTVGLISLCIGSFLNVVIYRTPKMMENMWHAECQMLLHPHDPVIEHEKLTLSQPASTCPKCKTGIKWYQNIPVISWLMLKGQCAHCEQKISLRYPAIELLTAIGSVVVAVHFGPTLQAVFGIILTWVLVTLTFIDFDTQLLPDRFTLTLVGLGLALNSYGLYISPVQSIWGAVIGFLCLWVVYIAFKLITGKEGMGYGDFKLLAALGAWMGPLLLPLIVFLSSLIGSIVGIILIKVRKKNMPFAFGPYIAIAGWIAFLWGEKIMALYLG
ncbi:A24 family peptidase [Acinetobacter apis]|uniref:Prepilin leader peptidase/N-methyltransferase n=1 Tax=Acinetobacter apis TaxID=1229165 RepID=A0A217EH43_9GAMM|nr:A24 family peptidase [Acinetobacter apis]SNQ29500.1 type 4 prepilin peptidase 1 Aspartic peptidase. MEROPS family A24A [Acinetobacter apis]